MKINILAFGIAREITGSSLTAAELTDGLRVQQLKNDLEEQYPKLKQLTSFMIAVNGMYAAPDIVIEPGDEVALIPPVSGG
jgi:molybdopterin synthase sulfur carrier subunit